MASGLPIVKPGIRQLTGDGTAGPGAGSQALTLATVNSNVGSFTLSTITVNAKGLVTAASAAATTGADSVVLSTSPVIVTPTIASFTNATHNHSNAAGGGTIAASVLTGTLAAAQMPALTGDVTTSAGGVATTLATVNSNVGSFTNADITVNAKGQITAAANGSSGSGNVVTSPAASTTNVIQPTGNFKALIIKNNASQAVNPFEVQSSAGTARVYVDSAGRFFSMLGISATNFIGGNAGKTTMSGTDVVAIGDLAGGSLTSGSGNVFSGTGAGQSVTSGSYNVLIGYQAGFSQTTQSFNTFVGRLAGQLATCSQCLYFGNAAGQNSTGISNVIMGDSSGDAASFSGSQNAVLGASAARSLTSSSENVFLGYSAGTSVTTGGKNILIGYDSGLSLSTGISNTAIGKSIGFASNTGNNQLNIASIIWGTGVNDVTGASISTGKLGISISAPSTKLHVREISSTAGVINVLTIDRSNASTPVAGDGTGILIVGKSSTTDLQPMALISTIWDTATDASRKASLHLDAYDTAVRANITIGANGSAATLGFYGVAAIARAVLATGAGATVDNVITALQNLGLVKQS